MAMSAVSVQKVAQTLSEKHQRGIRMTGTPGYQVEKDPSNGDVIITYYQPASMGQVGSEVLQPYTEDLESAGLDFTLDTESGMIKVTGRKNTLPGTVGRGMSKEARATISEKLQAHWATHEHPLKGKHMTDEARQSMRDKWAGRRVLIQLAMQLYKQALDEQALTLPEVEGVTEQQLMNIVKELASGYVAQARRDHVAGKKAEAETTISSNGAHPQDQAITQSDSDMEQGTLLLSDENNNNPTTVLYQGANPTTVLRQADTEEDETRTAYIDFTEPGDQTAGLDTESDDDEYVDAESDEDEEFEDDEEEYEDEEFEDDEEDSDSDTD